MYITESRWCIEQQFAIIKVIGSAPLCEHKIINYDIKRQMVNKMVFVIEKAEELGGKVLSTVPNFPKSKNIIYVSSCIIFNSQSNIATFKDECAKILNQG